MEVSAQAESKLAPPRLSIPVTLGEQMDNQGPPLLCLRPTTWLLGTGAWKTQATGSGPRLRRALLAGPGPRAARGCRPRHTGRLGPPTCQAGLNGSTLYDAKSTFKTYAGF